MSARGLLHAAVVARLKAAGLPGTVFDAPPVRSAAPQIVVEEPQLGAANAAGVAGRIGTIAVSYADGGERPVRLRGIVAAAEDAIEALASELGEGWRLVGLKLTRSRITRGKGDQWLATSEFAVRVFRADS